MPIFGALMGLFLLSGIAGAPGSATAPDMAPLPTYSVSLTAYNAVPEQTKPDPSTTANGGPTNPEVVAARSRDLADELPFGTVIELVGPAQKRATCGFDVVSEDIGYRVITDVMNERIVNTIDVLFDTENTYRSGTRELNASTVLGFCTGVTIRVVGHLDLTNPRALPQTQKELAALVRAGQSPLAFNK